VQQQEEELYLGWTEVGEWTNYTVNVKESGDYKIGTMYTSNRGGAIQLIFDNTDSTAQLSVKSTFDPDEPLAWRQWHHWNYSDSLTTFHLDKGIHVLKLLIAKEGNFNFDYLNFTNK
jgi:hypothetical protein